jgi:(2Fe-2S) ferredoxin
VGSPRSRRPAWPEIDAVTDAPVPDLAVQADPSPFYRAHVFVCCNRRQEGHPRGSCAARGSEKLRDYMKARAKELGLQGVRVNMAGCLDRCEFGPTMVIYPEGVWYRPETPGDVDEILSVHLRQGGRVRRLMLTEKDVPPPK